ncbi:hypothetical protein AKJ65_07670, partial [candidate division MSBL1 archaeon SCGC-AAA259E19]
MNMNEIVRAGQLASTFEIVAHPKPGNVHREADLKDETFEQFIAGAVVIGPTLRRAVKGGLDIGRGKIKASNVGVGELIKDGVKSTKAWIGKNTNLGVLMLLIPLTIAAGITTGKEPKFKIKNLRKNLSNVLKSTDSRDALDVYDAILIAEAGGLGEVDELSVEEESSKERIESENISLYDIMKISSDWDTISKEWITDMQITFEEGFPLLKKFYRKKEDLNTAVVQTFLKILSDHPDSLVKRKFGKDITKK